MRKFPPVGARVKWNALTPNPIYRDAVGTVVSFDGTGSVWIRIDEACQHRLRDGYDKLCRNPKYLSPVFEPATPEEIDEAQAGLERILES